MWSNKEISSNKRKDFKKEFKKSGTIIATIWVGKKGINEGLINQVNVQLKTKKLIKLKVQKHFLHEHSINEIAETIAKRTSSTIIDIMGRTFTLYKQ
ncbi:MAG: YhbY family RNA-binding protein [Candidatus Bathyarchaeia archaeon]